MGIKKFAFVSGSIFAGATHGFITGQPGHRIDSAKEGALMGAAAGAAIVAAPSVARLVGNKASAGIKRTVEAAKQSGKVVFRRLHGRIIPIRIP